MNNETSFISSMLKFDDIRRKLDDSMVIRIFNFSFLSFLFYGYKIYL